MVSDPSPVRTAGAEPETETEREIEATDASPEGDRPGADRTFRHRDPSRGGTTAETTPEAAADDGYACPLCGFSHESRDAVYTHLVLGHRKRAISSALLERQTTGAAVE